MTTLCSPVWFFFFFFIVVDFVIHLFGFKNIYLLMTNEKSALLKCLFFFFFAVPCGILVPRPGIAPKPPALEARSLSHWTTKEIPAHLVLTRS